MGSNMLTRRELEQAVDTLGLHGHVVEVHASLRSFTERVEATDLLTVFDDASMTALYPAFSHVFEVRPSTSVQLATNGYVYGDPIPCGAVGTYRKDHFDVDADLGVLPRVAVRSGAVRGDHPFNGFCATGPDAASVVGAQTPDDTYGPVAAGVERDGKLLLIGVGLERATCLHFAEQLAGRRQFVRWYCADGSMRPARTGGCSAAFDVFSTLVTPPRWSLVAGSLWSVFDLAELVDQVRGAVADDPLLGLCDADGCNKCRSVRTRL